MLPGEEKKNYGKIDLITWTFGAKACFLLCGILATKCKVTLDIVGDYESNGFGIRLTIV